MLWTYLSVETDNHFESNAASETDKENDMRHIPCTGHDTSSTINSLHGFVMVNNPWFELLADSSRKHTACVHA